MRQFVLAWVAFVTVGGAACAGEVTVRRGPVLLSEVQLDEVAAGLSSRAGLFLRLLKSPLEPNDTKPGDKALQGTIEFGLRQTAG